MEYYSATEKNKMSFTATWMQLDTIILSKVSQKEKDKYHMWNMVFPYMWNLKYDTNELNYETEIE